MSKNNRDIEYEMSKFEEELTKLTSSTFASSSSSSNQQHPPSSHQAQNKPKISIQMPTSLPASNQLPSVAHYSKMLPNQLNAYHQHASQSQQQSMASRDSGAGGIKRDATGRIINNNAQTSKTATGAPASEAGASAESADSKAKKAKDAKEKKKKKIVRSAGGQTWEDDTLFDWENDDFRLFCGDLGNEVTDESLARAFQKYPSFLKAKVIRDRRTSKTRGYGFVSFKNSEDFIKAMREMNGKYVGNRPIKLRKSNWKDRNLEMVRKKETEKQKMGLR